MKLFRFWSCVIALLSMGPTTWAQEAGSEAARESDHKALRAMLVQVTEALNTREFEVLAQVAHPGFTVITIDNQKLVGLDALRAYYTGLFEGPRAILSKMEVRPTADESTRFLDDTTGVVYGVAENTYHFLDGDVRRLDTRWSAVVEKQGDNWTLVNVHFSTNLLDNPMLDATRAEAQKIVVAAGAIGLALGALLMALLRRRPR